MLLGRRKSGFTEEQTLRPSEIPDYVNEENDTTFARPKSACMGHATPEASEPQAWIPPEPMPEYRLLREYIRSQCEMQQITPRAQLLCEDAGTAALLEQIFSDPACADITALEGQKDTYYYSAQVMSGCLPCARSRRETGNPCGVENSVRVMPSSRAFAFMRATKFSVLPATASASATAASFADCSISA